MEKKICIYLPESNLDPLVDVGDLGPDLVVGYDVLDDGLKRKVI